MSHAEHHPAFDWQRSIPVPTLNLELQEYRHRETGARHLHLASEDDQNTFMVAFATVPQDSTGVAHILEHTALCGSEHYPVRDPFFMMTRRSLNTFMNAFTASDWTAYPFATRNRKDFYNLLDVYLDAVFFPALDPLDFAQEGHRVEFAKPDDPESALVFKGVVYNEMKGAMSSPVATLYQAMTRHLFPTITYHYNSGGDPEEIPNLTHEQLKAFHASHYHPANALFFTYGDLPVAEHQARFHEKALERFSRQDLQITIPDERRYTAPLTVEEVYALDGEEETRDKTHIVLGWLVDQDIDQEAVLRAHLLSGVLLDNGASPLRRALETSELGSAPSPLCGLQDSTREMFFSAGLEGSNPEHADAVERLILDALHDVAENGVDQRLVEAVLHQLELSQREIGGDGMPYGLQLMVQTLGPTLHGADPAEVIDIDGVLARLREAIQEPAFIKGLARELLENSHRVRLVMRPDPQLSAERTAAEKARLAAIKERMSGAEKQQVIERAAELLRRQEAQDDPDRLPRVELTDIPADLPIPEGEADRAGPLPATWFSQGTNGLVYQELVVELPELEPELRDLLPIFCDCLPEVGSGGRDYLETQALQAAVTGGIGARATVRSAVDDLQRSRALFVLGGKALARNEAALTDLLYETFATARFDELPRLRELVAQERMEDEQSVTGNGHALAMLAAASHLTPSAALNHRWNGLAGIQWLKALDTGLDTHENLEALAAKLERLRDHLQHAPRQLLLIGEAAERERVEATLAGRWRDAATDSIAPFRVPQPDTPKRQGWSTSTQVNFCAKAYPAVPVDHPDAPSLMVLAGFLRNNFLHRAIREQGGAYGGGATFDSDAGAFRFFSYRDPRLSETLADFDRSISWLLEQQHEPRLVEEAILGVVSAIDKPGSPAGEARKSFHGALHGRTPEQRRRLRARVLEVNETSLKQVAERYLKPETASVAVVGNPSTLAGADLDLEITAL